MPPLCRCLLICLPLAACGTLPPLAAPEPPGPAPALVPLGSLLVDVLAPGAALPGDAALAARAAALRARAAALRAQ